MAMLRMFRRNIPAAISAIILLATVVCAVAAPYVATHDPMRQQLARRLLAPGEGDHLLGTDNYGRDVFSRLVYGARVSLLVGLVAVTIGAFIGVILGVLAGLAGGWVDTIIMRITDVFLSVPLLLLAMAIVAALGSSLPNVIIAIVVGIIPRFVRLVRSTTLTLRNQDFIEAARAIGVGTTRLITRHLLVNMVGPITVMATLWIPQAILTEAGLSFLGLGVNPPTPTWGNMISEGKQVLRYAPWVSASAGLVTMITVLAFNLVGDSLRDQLDPRLRGGQQDVA